MAIIKTDWYQSSISRSKITEIKISNASFVSDGETWDASANKDGSITCYRNGTTVRIVCTSVTVIEDKAFSKFLALKKISGLSSVTTIGAYAFCYTPNLASVDFVPGNLTSIGASAFRMSSIEDVFDLSAVPTNIIGDMATRHKRWDASTLRKISSVNFPRTVQLNVPNPDSQLNYPDVVWGTHNDDTVYVDSHGCSSFACYHIWNCLNAGTKKQYNNWYDWYNGTINVNGDFADYNYHDDQTVLTMVSKLGWTATGAIKVTNEEQLQTIIDRLIIGQPTHVVIHSANNPDAYHSVAIVGCDADTHKLAVVDSSAVENVGVVSLIAFEDIFVGGVSEDDKILLFNYNRPTLAPSCTWFTQCGTSVTRNSITEIYIEDSYTPTSTVLDSWDASAAKDGSIMAYVEGTKLTIAGNGSGKITMNPNSSRVFSDINKKDNFANVIEIHNTNLLDTAQVTTFANAFDRCFALQRFDGTGWNTGNVTSLQAMFQYCSSLREMWVRDWDTRNVTSITAFLNMPTFDVSNNFLKELDLSGWKVEKVTSAQSVFVSLRKLEVLRISGWNLHLPTNFASCFAGLFALKELDLSGIDTTNSANMNNALMDLFSLEKLTLGENFSFNGNGSVSTANTCVVPIPNGTYVDGADGNWYDVNGKAIAPTAIQNRTFGVYYATPALAVEDGEQFVMVKKGSLLKTAQAIRSRAASTSGYAPADFVDAILEIV